MRLASQSRTFETRYDVIVEVKNSCLGCGSLFLAGSVNMLRRCLSTARPQYM